MKHHEQVLNLLNTQIGNPAEVKDISDTAKKVANEWVNPVSGGKENINGLVYGLVQSGKTGVLSVSGAIGADEGYRTIIILSVQSFCWGEYLIVLSSMKMAIDCALISYWVQSNDEFMRYISERSGDRLEPDDQGVATWSGIKRRDDH